MTSPVLDILFKFQCDNNSPRKVPVSLTDRKSHIEGLICVFIAENDFLLSNAPKYFEFAKEIAKDSKALNDIKMQRTSD